MTFRQSSCRSCSRRSWPARSSFSLTLGDYITPDLVADAKFIGNVIYDNSSLGNLPVAAAYSLVPIAIMTVYLLVARDWAPSSRCEGTLMTGREADPPAPGDSRCPDVPVPAARHPRDLCVQRKPHPGVAAEWLHAPGSARRWPTRGHPGARQLDHRGHDRDRDRLVLGTLASLAVQRYDFFGRETISFFLVLPIAPPGV